MDVQVTMPDVVSRLHSRGSEHLHRVAQGQLVILSVLAAVVLTSIFVNIGVAYYLLTGDVTRYRALLLTSVAIASLLDTFFLILCWILFEMLNRQARDSERLQAFMDNVYRRL